MQIKVKTEDQNGQTKVYYFSWSEDLTKMETLDMSREVRYRRQKFPYIDGDMLVRSSMKKERIVSKEECTNDEFREKAKGATRIN